MQFIRLRFILWKLRAKMLGMVLLEALAFALTGAFYLAVVAGYFVYMYRGTLRVFVGCVAVGAAGGFAFGLLRNVWSYVEEYCDQPIRELLAEYPALKNLVQEVAHELDRPAPEAVTFLLSPTIWRPLGCDPLRLRHRQEVVIPEGCLEIWPVQSLRCHVGHALVRRRPTGLAFFIIRKTLARLEWEAKSPKVARFPFKSQPLLRFYLKAFMAWNMFADIEADARIARVLGAAAVSTWICQTLLAGHAVSTCLKQFLAPAAERGVLLPVASACAASYALIEPGWLEMIDAERVKAQRSKPAKTAIKLLLVRLGALPNNTGRVHDPRPAAKLLEAIPSLEERLMRHEAALGSKELRRAAISEIGEAVLVPVMREEVARNAAVLDGCSITDLPELISNAAKLVPLYHPNPQYLLAPEQRKAMVPQLLVAFLTTELERKGWTPGFVLPKGLTLCKGSRVLNPYEVVLALRKGQITREAFLQMIDAL